MPKVMAGKRMGQDLMPKLPALKSLLVLLQQDVGALLPLSYTAKRQH